MSPDTAAGTVSLCLAVVVWAVVNGCSGPAGKHIYRHSGCVKCHGTHLKGSHLGPSLLGLKNRWERQELVRFLTNPLAYKDRDKRLKTLARRYPAPMPMFIMGDADRERLVDFLLSVTP